MKESYEIDQVASQISKEVPHLSAVVAPTPVVKAKKALADTKTLIKRLWIFICMLSIIFVSTLVFFPWKWLEDKSQLIKEEEGLAVLWKAKNKEVRL